MTRKKKKDDEIVDKDEVYDDDPFFDFPGLEEEGSFYYIERKLADGTKEYLCTETVYSLSELEKDFGGGHFFIDSRDSEGKILGRKQKHVGGPPRYRKPIEQANDREGQPVNSLQYVKEIVEVAGQLKDGDKTDVGGQAKMMAMFTDIIGKMMITNIEQSQKMSELLSNVDRKETGTGIAEVLSVALEKIGDAIHDFVVAKHPHVATDYVPPVEIEGAQVNTELEGTKKQLQDVLQGVKDMNLKHLVFRLNEGQEKKLDHSDILKEIKQFYPTISCELKKNGYKKAMNRLKFVGLKVTNEDWLVALYTMLTGEKPA